MGADFRAALAAKPESKVRYAVPQVDPGEQKPVITPASEESTHRDAAVEPQPQPAVLTPQAGQPERPEARVIEETEQQASTTKMPRISSRRSAIYITPVDKTEHRKNATVMMYPSRQEQLNDLEHVEGRKRWKIIDQALDEYIERNYGIKP